MQQLHERPVAAGIAPDDQRIAQWLEITQQFMGMPRHLSQHVGGFVLTRGKLTRLVPVDCPGAGLRAALERLVDLTALLGGLATQSRELH